MTTYCLNPNATWLAVYTLNTGTMPTNNVVFSKITANLSSSATSITITSGEGTLFSGGMVATIEQLNDEGKATAREVVLINSISTDTLTITRGYEQCVIDDTASPKVMGNTPQTFTSGARISVYVSKALLNGVQTRLSQINNPCNTQVYNDSLAMSSCVENNCNDRRDKLLKTKACNCYNDKGFGSGCDGDCVMSGNVFLCANKEYEFNNLTIQSGALVRFEGQGVPTIRVKRCFCNLGTIDLRGGTFVGCCSATDVYSNKSIGNNADSTAYNSMCFGCGGSGKNGGCSGGNATASCGGNGGDAQNGCAYIPATCASGYNGGNGAEGESCPRNGRKCGSGGGGGGVRTGNGGNGGDGYSGSASDNYSMDGGDGGNGGNGGIWGKGGNGGRNGSGYASGMGGNGGNGYIGGNGGGAIGGRDCMSSGCAGDGGNGIIQGGTGGCSGKAMGTKGGQGGNAINNMYGFRLYACEVYNNVICAKGGNGGAGGCNTMPSSYTHGGGNGGCGANGGKVFIGYFRSIEQGTVDISGGNGGAGGVACGGSCNYGCPGASGCAGCRVICKIM